MTSHACAVPRRLFFWFVLAEGDIVPLHIFSNMFIVNGGDTRTPKRWPTVNRILRRCIETLNDIQYINIFRAKRVSHRYVLQKKSARVPVCSTNLGFSGENTNIG